MLFIALEVIHPLITAPEFAPPLFFAPMNLSHSRAMSYTSEKSKSTSGTSRLSARLALHRET